MPAAECILSLPTNSGCEIRENVFGVSSKRMMDLSLLRESPHRRYNPLTREWVLVSPQRTLRPWQGKMEKLPVEEQPTYDPGCYLCPGNSRAGGSVNPKYSGTFVFDNDYAALRPDVEEFET